MKRNPVETVLGAVVLVIAGMFLAFAYSTADLGAATGYPVIVRFSKVGGLENGSDVRISGISIGTVTSQALDPSTYEAQVTINIAPGVELPADTEAAVVSDGLLGGKYVNLTPGQSAERIPPGGQIVRARDYQSLEDLVGEIIFLATQSNSTGAPATEAPPEAPK